MKIRNLLIVGLVACFAGACTAPDRSAETLKKAGYTDIKITGYEPWACGEDDDFHTGFLARNPNGDWVDGVVCCGIMKRCTIRL